jgi:hypothetical protein
VKPSRIGPRDDELPADVVDVLVSALADALVLEMQELTGTSVISPRGCDRPGDEDDEAA